MNRFFTTVNRVTLYRLFSFLGLVKLSTLKLYIWLLWNYSNFSEATNIWWKQAVSLKLCWSLRSNCSIVVSGMMSYHLQTDNHLNTRNHFGKFEKRTLTIPNILKKILLANPKTKNGILTKINFSNPRSKYHSVGKEGNRELKLASSNTATLVPSGGLFISPPCAMSIRRESAAKANRLQLYSCGRYIEWPLFNYNIYVVWLVCYNIRIRALNQN